MKYNYTSVIENKLQIFDACMQSKSYSKDTIRQNRNYVGIYLEWLSKEDLHANEVSYKELMDFIFQLKKEKSEKLVNRIVLAVRHYYKTLETDKNPAAGLYIRQRRSSILNDLVDYKKLLQLYNEYPRLDNRDKRNKVILGMLIHQGLSSREISLMRIQHVKIESRKLYVPEHSKANRRTLDLHADQLLELQAYLIKVRPQMLSGITDPDPLLAEKLFFSERGNQDMKNSLWHMFRAIKNRNPQIRSAKVIRSTVIAEWLKTTDIRMVQYMCGHKWVSSTERYNALNLEDLKEQLKKYHPLK